MVTVFPEDKQGKCEEFFHSKYHLMSIEALEVLLQTDITDSMLS